MELSKIARAPGPLTVVGKALAVVAPLVAASCFYVWSQSTTVRLGYLLSQASDVHKALTEQNKGLRIEVAWLLAPERLKMQAPKYGLEAPRPEQVVRLDGRLSLEAAQAKVEVSKR